jgi:hypothetical protein
MMGELGVEEVKKGACELLIFRSWAEEMGMVRGVFAVEDGKHHENTQVFIISKAFVEEKRRGMG